MTPDGTRIGIAKDSTVALIDAVSGKLIRRERKDGFGGAICLDNDKVLAVYPKLLVELTGDKQVERNERTFTIVGAVGSEGLVHYGGGKLSSSRSSSTSPLEVYFEKFGVVTKNPQPIVLPPENFQGLQPKKFAYWMIPVRVLNDGKLLVAAGSRPSYGVSGSQKPTLSQEPWGFFLVTPQTGDVRTFGDPKTQDPDINFIYVPKTHATPGGSFVAVTNSVGSNNNVAVWSDSGNRLAFKRNIANAREIKDVVLSDDGGTVAVLVSSPDAFRIEAYDIQKNSLINSFILNQINLSSSEFLHLHRGELVLADYDGTVAKTNIETGSMIWLTKLDSK